MRSPLSCCVKKPGGGGTKGQICTGHDLNLAYPPGPRPFASSRTYQTYGPIGHLSLGFAAIVRIESIAIDVVQRDKLDQIYLNICDAGKNSEYYCLKIILTALSALVEFYRVDNNLTSLFGTVRVPDYDKRKLEDLVEKMKPFTISTPSKTTPKKKKEEAKEEQKEIVDPRSPQKKNS